MSRRAMAFEPSTVYAPQLLRLSEAAAIARLSVRTLRRAIHASRDPLRCYRFGRAVRIAPDDLAAWVRAHAASPTVSTKVLETLSADAKALIQSLARPTNRGARSGDRTAKVSPKPPANILAPAPATRLDYGAELSVHVATDGRSKEESIAMQEAPQKGPLRAIPTRTARAR